MARLELFPAGKILEVAEGTPLREALFAEGFEFPCGGRGRCRGCRVKLLKGEIPESEADRQLLDAEALKEGWRLSCQAAVRGSLEIEAAQWEMPVLGDERHFHFTPGEGLAVAIDLGTTTIVAQLLDRRGGSVLGVASALNAQARHGADLMTRLDFAMQGGAEQLARLAREQLAEMVAKMTSEKVSEVAIVGNTAMHHLFCGLPLDTLAEHPFEPADDGLQILSAEALGWNIGGGRVSFLPCLGGFVGSDLLAGILATGMHLDPKPSALLDLGTNGEIVVGNRDRILCASTAAGPAFEGARISMGMRAATGAISAAALNEGIWECQVLGGGAARGLCGSGLVDAVAAGLDCGAILPTGRLATGSSIPLRDGVSISQQDVRELQLAKGAIAAGLQMLARVWGIDCAELDRVHLAGAFGNYINQASARRIGLLPVAQEKIVAAGNTALLGAKMALFQAELSFAELRSKVRHVPLNEDPKFQETYVDEMRFPESCL